MKYYSPQATNILSIIVSIEKNRVIESPKEEQDPKYTNPSPKICTKKIRKAFNYHPFSMDRRKE